MISCWILMNRSRLLQRNFDLLRGKKRKQVRQIVFIDCLMRFLPTKLERERLLWSAIYHIAT